MKISTQKMLRCFTEILIYGLPIASILIFLWICVLCIFSNCIDACSVFSGLLDFLKEPKFLMKVFGGCLSLWVVVYNLKKYIDVETINALHMLRDSLNTKEKKKIHANLMSEEDKNKFTKGVANKKEKSLNSADSNPPNSIELLDYLGTIELGAIMLDKNVISVEEFKNQFGYRVENILNNEDLNNYLHLAAPYYEDFLKMAKRLYPDNLNCSPIEWLKKKGIDLSQSKWQEIAAFFILWILFEKQVLKSRPTDEIFDKIEEVAPKMDIEYSKVLSDIKKWRVCKTADKNSKLGKYVEDYLQKKQHTGDNDKIFVVAVIYQYYYNLFSKKKHFGAVVCNQCKKVKAFNKFLMECIDSKNK